MKLPSPDILKSISLAIFSALLLFLSFPKFDFFLLAWIGLVPLHWVIFQSRPWRAFFLSSLTGFLYLALVFAWALSIPGYRFEHHFILGCYSSLFFGIYGISVNFISRRLGPVPAGLCAPAIWVTIEYLRSNLFFLALPWALLAHSQHGNLPVIQIASFVGAYGISFMIILVNIAIYQVFRMQTWLTGSLLDEPSRTAKTTIPVTALGVLILVLGYGYLALSGPKETRPIRASVLQGNIGPEKKGNPRIHGPYIMGQYFGLTRKAAQDKPDLIVWPEAATPGFLLNNLSMLRQMKTLISETGAYFLIGTSEIAKFGTAKPGTFNMGNTALYLSPNGSILDKYLKIHLVPFGEYIPLEKFITWPNFIVPDPKKFREIPGKEFTLFNLRENQFGVVICWEHVFPDLFRTFIKNGANFMLNITNEAWFGDTAAPHQMLAISVFRAVENHCAIARAANTGISCFIDPNGRITGRVQNSQKKDTFISGWLTGEISPSNHKTFYTRHGDIFAFSCILLSLLAIVASWVLNRLQRKNNNE
jgi:apolipoprotein N-acyltransferase